MYCIFLFPFYAHIFNFIINKNVHKKEKNVHTKYTVKKNVKHFEKNPKTKYK